MGIFKRLNPKHRSSMRKAGGRRKGGSSGERCVASEAGARRYGVPIGTPLSQAKAKRAAESKTGAAGKGAPGRAPNGSEAARQRAATVTPRGRAEQRPRVASGVATDHELLREAMADAPEGSSARRALDRYDRIKAKESANGRAKATRKR